MYPDKQEHDGLSPFDLHWLFGPQGLGTQGSLLISICGGGGGGGSLKHLENGSPV